MGKGAQRLSMQYQHLSHYITTQSRSFHGAHVILSVTDFENYLPAIERAAPADLESTMINFLESVLAFALSMIIFSTLVSIIVEGLNGILARRALGLQQMMSRFFDDLLWDKFRFGIIARYAPGMAPTKEKLREDFLEEVTRNFSGGRHNGNCPRWIYKRWRALRDRQFLTLDEFVRRLANTDAGRAIGRYDQAEMKTVIQDLAYKFVDHASDARLYFRKKTRFISIVVSILLAGFANIDAFRLFDQFTHSPGIVRTLLAEDTKVIRNYEASTAAAGKEDAKQPSKKQPENGSSNQAPKPDASESGLEAQLAKVRDRIGELSSNGLALGKGYYPFCTIDSTDAACESHVSAAADKCKNDKKTDTEIKKCQDESLAVQKTLKRDLLDGFYWLFRIFLTGMLIGLGGPFWFDFYLNLSRWVNVLPGRRGKAVETEGRDTVAGPEGAKTATIDATALAASFKQHIEAQKILGTI